MFRRKNRAAATDLIDIEMSVRVYKCLKRRGIETVADIYAMGVPELLQTPNFGIGSLNELQESLEAHGFARLQESCPTCGKRLGN